MQVQRGTVVVGAQTYDYIMRRSRRARNLLLHVAIDGSIEVVVPWRTAYREGQRFLRDETEWLSRALEKNKRRQAAVPRRRLVNGDVLPILGERVALEVVIDPDRQRARWQERAGTLTVFAPRQADVRRVVRSWYKQVARGYFEQRSRSFASKLGVRVVSLRVSEATTQWGSCIKEKGRLSLNWRLLLGPRAAAEYVVAHEVAHLRERGHTPDFWRLVERLDPTFQHQRAWLRKHGFTLVL